jgi:hypothetical protein
MNKPLILPSAAIMLICALLSSWLNYQSSSIESKQRDLLDLSNQQKTKNTWADVLSQLPQYGKTVEVKTEPEVVQQPKISDSIIIGIIVDKPKSVLLLINSQTDAAPQQLNVGDGWLDSWIILEIAPDSITWTNKLTQQNYIQTLFADLTGNSEDLKLKTGTQ